MPYDSPARPDLNDSPTYTVATMHTHTVYRYLTPGRTRLVGPSDTDRRNAANRGIPTIVIDYVGNHGRIHGGWPIHARTRNYTTDPSARKPPWLT